MRFVFENYGAIYNGTGDKNMTVIQFIAFDNFLNLCFPADNKSMSSVSGIYFSPTRFFIKLIKMRIVKTIVFKINHLVS